MRFLRGLVLLLAALPCFASCLMETPYAGCVHYIPRDDGIFALTHNPTQTTKNFFLQHDFRVIDFYGSWDPNLSWYPNTLAYFNSDGINNGDPIVTQHPDWVMHDAAGNPLWIGYNCTGSVATQTSPKVLGTCSRYVGDFTNSAFRAWKIAQAQAVIAIGYKGFQFDDVNLNMDAVEATGGSGTQVPPIDPATGAPMTQAAWQTYFSNFITQYRTAFGPNVEIDMNAVWYQPSRPAGTSPAQKAVIAATNKWMMIERGTTDGGITGGTGQFSLRALYTYIDQVHLQGRYVHLENFVSGGNQDYGPASYLLISSGLDTFCNNTINPSTAWPPDLDVDMGAPLGPRFESNGGIRRNFANGYVIVVSPGDPAISYTPTDGKYKTVAGDPIASVALSAGQGLILLNANPVTVGSLTFSPATGWGFGPTTVGVNQPSGTISATNSGTIPVAFSTVTITGANPADFPITSNTCIGTLAAGAACNVTFNFFPQATGARAGNLTFTDNASGSPQSIVLTGTGTAPTAATLSLSTSSVSFGSTTVGSTSPALSISATNTSSTAVNFTSVTLTGANVPDYAITANTCIGSLAAGAACNVSYTFTPTAIGTRTATISFADNATGSPQTVSLTGTGTATPPPPGSTLSFSFPSWTFGAVTVGQNVGAGRTTATNTGNAAVNISSIAFVGGNASDFPIVSNTCPAQLAIGGNCTVTFNFAPSAVGARSSSLTFTDDATGSPQVIAVSGTGASATAGTLSLSNTTWDFGSVDSGQASPLASTTVTNTGTTPVTFSDVSLTGPNSGDFVINATSNCTGTLAAAATCNLSYGFAPSSDNTGVLTANLTLTDDATGSPQSITLTGTETIPPASIGFGNLFIDFGPQTINTTSDLRNDGVTNFSQNSVSFSSVAITGANATDFAVASSSCSLLAASTACSISITFRPTALGTRTANLVFTDSAVDSPQTVTLQGTGQAAQTGGISLSANATWAFGAHPIGETSGLGKITATNTSTSTVTFVTTVGFGGTDPQDFAVVTDGCSPFIGAGALAPGASCTMTFTFTPTDVGTRTAQLVFSDDAPDVNQIAAISGTGLPSTTPPVRPVPPAVMAGKTHIGGKVVFGLNDVQAPPPILTTATPAFSPAAGTYTGTQSVTLSDATTGAVIYYTTDGSTPTTASAVYGAPIPVSASETISAFAVAPGDAQSPTTSAAYTIQIPVVTATPTFSLAGGVYTGTQTVTIADTTAGASVFYTVDGSTPTISSTQYIGAISVASSETIKAFARLAGNTDSAVASVSYTIQAPTATAAPTFSPAGGTFTTTQSVTLADATSGATIFYTTDGSTPTTAATVYSAPISVTSTKTIKAFATAATHTDSTVVSATYTIQPITSARYLYAVNESVSNRGTISVYDINNNHSLVRIIPTVASISDIRGAVANAATDRMYVSYTSGTTGKMFALDLKTDAILWNLTIPSGVDRMAISPDGQTIYSPTSEDNNIGFINVLNANTGAVIRTVSFSNHSHDTQYPLSGPVFQETKATDGSGKFLYKISPSTFAVTQVGPFSNTLAPFAVDSTSHFAVANVFHMRGFQIADLTTNTIATATRASGDPGLGSHGIGWTPDQTEVWVTGESSGDNHVYVWNMTNPMAPTLKQTLTLRAATEAHFLTFSIDGTYAYVAPAKNSSTPTEIFNAKTHTTVGTIAASEEMFEVDFTGTNVTAVGDQYGIGRK